MSFFKLSAIGIALVIWQASSWASIPLGGVRKSADGKFDLYGCMQSNAYYIVNFAAYQQDPNKPVTHKTLPPPECVNIPAIGPTFISVDLLDRDVRRKQVALKIVREDGQTVAELPYFEPKQGVAALNVDFKTAGHYTAVLYVNDTDLNMPPESSALRIPLTVALVIDEPATKTALNGFFIVLATLVAALAFAVPRWLKTPANLTES
jgi:hypothetical protein